MFQAPRRAARGPFAPRFRAICNDFHARRELRGALGGATLAGVAAALLATALWSRGHGPPTLAPLALLALGGGSGWALARLRRWPDEAVALYLDARAGTSEVITTALAARGGQAGDEFILSRASEALACIEDRHLPLRWTRSHLAVGLAIVVTLSLAATASGTRDGVPRPADIALARAVLQLDAVPGLRPAERLTELRPRDPARNERLNALAQEARRLEDQLRAGADPRRAAAALEALQEALRRERDAVGAGNESAGMEAAARRLSEAGLESAAQALREGDLAALDQAMERLANSREASDRERARQALSDAAREAGGAGAPQAAQALREEESLLRQRGRRNERLRQLAQELGRDEAVRRAAEHLDRAPSDAAARDLARSLEQALASLSAEERRRLSERIAAAARRAQSASRAGAMGQQGEPGSEGRGAGQSEGQGPQDFSPEAIARALREIANSDPEGDGQNGGGSSGGGGQGLPIPVALPGGSSAMGLQRALQRAMDGASQAGQQMAAAQGGGQGQGGQGQGGRGGDGDNGSEGQGGASGPSRGGGRGGHQGQTTAVQGRDGLRARVGGPLQRGASMPGGVRGLTQGQTGGAARVVRTGALQSAAPSELRGVERTDVPPEYRDQVRVYFQP